MEIIVQPPLQSSFNQLPHKIQKLLKENIGFLGMETVHQQYLFIQNILKLNAIQQSVLIHELEKHMKGKSYKNNVCNFEKALKEQSFVWNASLNKNLSDHFKYQHKNEEKQADTILDELN